MSKADIEGFLQQMREQHAEEIESILLPEGTREYILEQIERGDADTLMFMLKLGYLMGLQTGYAAGQAGEPSMPDSTPGPIQA